MILKFRPYLLILVLFLGSCVSKKNSTYLQGNYIETELNFQNQKIQKNDILDLNVSALDMSTVIGFKGDPRANTNMNVKLLEGYKVDENGNVNLPIIGNVLVENLSLEQASKKIQDLLEESIIDPIVSITIISYKITILGEVNNPGTFSIYDSKLNIFQALGMAGDISIYGKKRKVKILREKDGKIIKRTIDLSKSDILNSEFFYVKNNDIIYVESNLSKRSSSGYFGNLSSVTSLLSFFISIFLLTSNN